MTNGGVMTKIGLSVIIPVYNAVDWIEPTVKHVVGALQSAQAFDAEIIIIDDGSTDGSVTRARSIKMSEKYQIKVVSQKNKGRYLARKRGVELSKKENILFIDSRVFINQDALHFLAERLRSSADQIWNAHVNIDKKGNVFARFWDAIVFIGWRRYFRSPKTTSYGIDEFDYYPKGTTMIYMPKKRLVAAMEDFESTTNDIEFSSDDTLLIRYMAERQPINISPGFSCIYHGRSTLKKFLLHAYDRGQFFVDGFLRPGTRFFIPLILFLIATPLAIFGLVLYPALLFGLLGLWVAELLVARLLGVPVADSLSLFILSPLFALVYGAGIWRGVFRKLSAS